MYGAICGDLAGSIYEYNQVNRIRSISTAHLITDKSFYSDDSILTIAVADAIINNKDYDYYLRKYINEYKDYKPNYGPYFETIFSPNLIKWSESNNIGNSRGNGAIMRVSPVGFMFKEEKEVIENAKMATMPSHNTKEAIDSATTISLIIFYLRNGYSKEEIIKKLKLDIKYNPFKKFNTTCEETKGNCLYAFFNSNSFEDAIRKTLLMGGDTDTNCAIVGSLADAYYGVDDGLKEQIEQKIPNEFVKILKRNI